ncbi:MAG: hypothetical protein VXV96_04300 [Bdellovibrionota bacterium]|nr:hypothetical protein [Bdellovibrionota bacterium]
MKDIEDKSYGPQLSPEEINLLSSQVILLKKDTILYQEVYKMTEVQLEVMFKKLHELLTISPPPQVKKVILDISRTDKPDAKTRELLKFLWKPLLPYIDHIYIITGRNAIANVAARFVASSLGLSNFSIHKTREEAK